MLSVFKQTTKGFWGVSRI